METTRKVTSSWPTKNRTGPNQTTSNRTEPNHNKTLDRRPGFYTHSSWFRCVTTYCHQRINTCTSGCSSGTSNNTCSNFQVIHFIKLRAIARRRIFWSGHSTHHIKLDDNINTTVVWHYKVNWNTSCTVSTTNPTSEWLTVSSSILSSYLFDFFTTCNVSLVLEHALMISLVIPRFFSVHDRCYRPIIDLLESSFSCKLWQSYCLYMRKLNLFKKKKIENLSKGLKDRKL